MNAARFHNALRIMMNLDRHHLVDAGVLAADDDSAWKAFRDYPHEASLHLNDANFDKLFALIESRQRETDRLAEDQLRELADDAFQVLNWAKRMGMRRDQQIDETVKAFEVRLGYREPVTVEARS